MFSEPLSQYEEILKDAIRTSMKESGAKLAKTFQTLLIDSFYLLPFIEAIICHTSDKNGDKYISQLYCLIEIS